MTFSDFSFMPGDVPPNVSVMPWKIVGMMLGVLIAGAVYFAWLDSGCELGGMMTWDGKVCVESIVP